jgi:hypothetical protein
VPGLVDVLEKVGWDLDWVPGLVDVLAKVGGYLD